MELEKMRNLEKKASIIKLLQLATLTQEIDENIDLRSRYAHTFPYQTKN